MLWPCAAITAGLYVASASGPVSGANVVWARETAENMFVSALPLSETVWVSTPERALLETACLGTISNRTAEHLVKAVMSYDFDSGELETLASQLDYRSACYRIKVACEAAGTHTVPFVDAEPLSNSDYVWRRWTEEAYDAVTHPR